MKYEGLSYPTHLLKIGGVASRIILLNTEINKSTYLSDEMFYIHYWLQIKQNVNSLGTFRAPVATQSIVKVSSEIAKSLMFDRIQLLY